MPTDPLDRAVAAAFRLDESLSAREAAVSLERAEARVHTRRSRRRLIPFAGVALIGIAAAGSFVAQNQFPTESSTPGPQATTIPYVPTAEDKKRNELEKKLYATVWNAPRTHLMIRFPEYKNKTREIWREGKRFRDETAERLYLSDGDRRWVWLKEEKLAFTWRRFPDDSVRYTISPNFRPGLNYEYSSLAVTLVPPWGVREERLSPAAIEQNGKTSVIYPSPDGTKLFLDSTRSRPIRETRKSTLVLGDGYANYATAIAPPKKPDGQGGFILNPQRSLYSGGGGIGYAVLPGGERKPPTLKVVVEATARYDANPPAGAFQFTPPVGTKTIDLDAVREKWLKKLAGPPLATIRYLGKTCTIQNLSVGSQGEIFVLYRGSWPKPTAEPGIAQRIQVRDDHKARYRNLIWDKPLKDTLVCAGDSRSDGIQLLTISPLQRPASPARELFFVVDGKETAHIPLPAPEATETPEYSFLLAPKPTVGEARQNAIQIRLSSLANGVDSTRPIPETIAEAEGLVQKIGVENTPWRIRLWLGLLNEKAGRKDRALTYLSSAERDYRKRYWKDSDGKPERIPDELRAALDRLAP